ncbi:MAG: twin-arginine translocase TatA/TatE family subunit [Myxococcales bacterium]|nr:twin-arginine translocase TatA/TatE family subunit [Myxococcales bacterium]
MLGLRPMEIALIVFALLLLFGASRLPQLGSSLGSAIRNFKKGFSGDPAEDKGGQAGEKKLAEGQGNTLASSDKAASKQG